jgi:hypothetical protein
LEVGLETTTFGSHDHEVTIVELGDLSESGDARRSLVDERRGAFPLFFRHHPTPIYNIVRSSCSAHVDEPPSLLTFSSREKVPSLKT